MKAIIPSQKADGISKRSLIYASIIHISTMAAVIIRLISIYIASVSCLQLYNNTIMPQNEDVFCHFRGDICHFLLQRGSNLCYNVNGDEYAYDLH